MDILNKGHLRTNHCSDINLSISDKMLGLNLRDPVVLNFQPIYILNYLASKV